MYKLFDLRSNGSLGKKISFRFDAAGLYNLDVTEATLADTLQKLSLLNDAGALPTEIVGLSLDGHFLIVKQPRAFPMENYEKDRDAGVQRIRGIVSPRARFRSMIATIVDSNGSGWFVGDLHDRNIMRDSDGMPTIIDALVGPVPPFAIGRLDWLREAIDDALAWRKTGRKPPIRTLTECNDDEL